MAFRLALAVLLAVSLSAQSAGQGDALFAALAAGRTRDVERLIKSGVSPNVADGEGTPALMAATLYAGVDDVDLLLKNGANPDQPDASGATALMWAVPDLAKVKLLLAHGANVNARSASERTPLLVAAAYPRTTELIRLLLDRGAHLRAQDRAGATALSLALRSADVEVVQFLVGRGLDPKELSEGARRVAFSRWDRPTTDYLMSLGQPPIPGVLLSTANWQPIELVGRWIASGTDVNFRNAAQYGRTPLLNAVTSEREGAATIKLLLERGADPNTPTTEDETPLDWAIYKGDRAKIQVLEERGIADPRVSLNRSVARVLEAASTFKEKTNCISCHHNGLPAMAAGVARRKGIEVDARLDARNLDDMLTFFRTNSARVMLGDPAVGGEALTVGYTQLGLAAEGYKADKITATMTHWLLARQMPDGSWLGNGLNRPPLEYSIISHTAMAAGGLAAYPLAGRQDQMKDGLRRARQYLLAAQPQSAEERGMRLMGLVWTGAPRKQIQAAIADVRAQQQADGGWSQFDRTEPDAYASGLSLYALHVAGVVPTDAAYRKGVAFLLGTQYQDGAWLVKTHSFPVQRYFESGFPFGRHQWISAAGTSWAALAIAETLPDKN
jgi:ankyrin repeat protein